ncbi:MAG: replicative DNA helicase, partial [Gammaproteobacteria bacterium]
MSEALLSTPPDLTQEPQSLRVPPHSVEAEQSVLGGLMLDNQSWDRVGDKVIEDDFYRADHRHIFRAIASLAERNQPFDVVTLSEWLDSHGELENVGGLAYLGRLANETPSAANIDAYADIIHEHSVKRQLIRVGTDIANSGYKTEGRGSSELLDNAERHVFEIADRSARGRQGFTSITPLLTRVVDRLDHLYNADSPITGLPTGFDDFDERTSGLQPGDLIIVAGRPSMGKTSFAMNVAEHVALKTRESVAIFSMEMPGEQLALRMVASLGRIEMQKIRTGRLSDDDWPRVTSAVSMLSEVPIYIDDGSALSPTEIRARSRRIMREHGLSLIVIDYLQLMQVHGSSENRATEISEISRSLKALAKELHVPVIALSQLNRSLEQRPNKRPVMSDLRESGAIEQDADLIVFIYRDEVYNEDSPDKGVAEIITGKQRNGPIGVDRLTFLGQYTKFENFI